MDQSDFSGVGMLLIVGLVLVWVLIMIISMWMVFEKAGVPGWGAIVPIYNLYCMLKIASMSGWWLIAFFIPYVSIVPSVMMPMKIAKNFGKGALFGLGLLLLSFIFYPILAFGEAQWSEA